ncbi:MAG: PHP domain-containing protein [Kosmotogaceae bacterium]
MIAKKYYDCDFHIHTCLSPCADITMVPGTVGERLSELGIDWVAITDHNTCGNVRVFQNALNKKGINVIPGIEVQSLEDVHILGYFNSVDIAEEYSKWLENKMKKVTLDPDKFGYQLYVNENDEFYSIQEIWLGQPVNLNINDVFSSIQAFNGIAAFAHIERKMGVWYQMGFIPEMKAKPVIEISFKNTLSEHDFVRNYPIIHSSDAHNIDMLKPTMKISTSSRNYNNFKNSIINNNPENRVKIIWD